jgi:hypothetical protein
METWFSELGSADKIATISAVAAFLQFIALVATWSLMRRSTRQQMRAYVSGWPEFISSFDESHWPLARYALKNVGQTPAHDLVHRSEIAVFLYPLPADFKLPAFTGRRSAPIVLFPNVPILGNVSRGRYFTADELTGIRDRAMRVYIFGEIRYRDVFRRRHRSTFCASVDIPEDDVLKKMTSNSVEVFTSIKYEAAFPTGNTSR